METRASIIEHYSRSIPEKRIDIILANYPNFLEIVEAHTKCLVHVISSEKMYKRKSQHGNQKIRVQVSGISNPTADRAIENVRLTEEIKKCNFDGDLLKDIDPKDKQVFRRDILTMQMMREEYGIIEAQISALRPDESKVLMDYIQGEKSIQLLAEELGITYEAVKQKIKRIRNKIKMNSTLFMRDSL